jgi:hypothetical protein
MKAKNLLSRRNWQLALALVAGMVGLGLLVWGAAPLLALATGAVPLLMVVACLLPCLVPLALLRGKRGGQGADEASTD